MAGLQGSWIPSELGKVESRPESSEWHCHSGRSDQAHLQLIMSQQALHNTSCGRHLSQGPVQEATNVKWVWVKHQVV